MSCGYTVALSEKYQLYYAFADIKPAIFIPIPTGLLISFGLSTKSPITFFPPQLVRYALTKP